MDPNKLLARYAWCITKDFDYERTLKEGGSEHPEGTNDNAKGKIGPCNPGLKTVKEIREHPGRERFCMYDDDDYLIYEGFMVHDKHSEGFEPLEDFGTPNYGCTYIKYFNPKTRKWEIL
jgi:hypothetical protein